MQYESPSSSSLRVMATDGRTEVRKYGRSRYYIPFRELRYRGDKNFGTERKVMSLEIHMCNKKALSLLIQKLWSRLKFLKSRSNSKVKVTRSKILVSLERSCNKAYTCEILKPYHLPFKSYGQG